MSLDFWDLILGGLSALAASVLSAFAGGGLSLMLFPLLLMLFPFFPYASLFTMTKVSSTVMTLVSSRIHLFRNQLNRKLIVILTISQLMGTAIGTYLLQYHFDEQIFTNILGTTVLAAAGYLLIKKELGLNSLKGHGHITRGHLWAMAGFAIGISILNGLFGGTGIFVTLYLVGVMRMGFVDAIAHAMPSFAVLNVVQTLYLLITESVDPLLTTSIVIGSMVGGWIGTHAQYLKGNVWVRRVAIVVMAAIGIKMFW